ncbi:hypothetical protein K491DRAFT_587223 [Lophiostoma macrostomum CBS 122681]|uniref:HTH La-type RNA-binding domain-containing protein n=1 Tax=Lophiostoma macrostomum CBS 122681 TaxID=1314788 RepID=A0A6A6TQ22_9PLEO|nr:hypothetical protein K491DRAFT_587223 [Lophiostoma macrostomum CBS 122681]
MATSRRSGSDVSAVPVPFSYAQAAKGLSNSSSSTAAPSKPSSGTTTPSKEAHVAPSTAHRGSVPSWADDAEAEDTATEKPQISRDSRTSAGSASVKPTDAQNPITTSGVSSPDLSSSTIVKDDDLSSQHASSESTSTWENKSQASTSVEKTTEPVEKTSEKVKGKNSNKDNFKPLQDAPIPAVNPWARRAELSAKTAQKPAPVRPTNGMSTAALPNGVQQNASITSTKKEKGTKTRDDDRVTQHRGESKQEVESDRSKKNTRGKPFEKDVPKPLSAPLPLPPDRDQESWPTPESAIDEDRKKSQGKGEKTEKERKESTSNQPHGKKEWVTVPYTPTVVFNTPLPNAAGARRGGRGGGRGGAQGGGRPTGLNASGSGPADKEASTPSTLANGDPTRRGRSDATITRDDIPKEKRSGSVGSSPLKEGKLPTFLGEKSSKPLTTPEAENASRRGSIMNEATSSAFPGQNNTFPRQYTSNRPNKNRKGEFASQGDRRKDSDSVSPTKETSGSFDRRTSTATQTDAIEDGDRRSFTFQDAQNSGRGHQNGHHQFSNGHAPTLQPSSTFPLRSPTTFHPEQTPFFPSQSSSRGYRNGLRTQSVTTENMYGRVPGYPGGPQQVPPIQTYGGGMYDYPAIHPMSAVPFSPYGVDHPTLVSMVSTQLEYYFSVDNLCKDMFLRKHMDSQGFVFLSIIAAFNRIRQLTTDMELIKYVCYQSRTIEFRVGPDGRDRLRPHEGWAKWVLAMPERDPAVQNDGPGELHPPPQPHPNGFEQVPYQQYPSIPAGTPSGPVPYPSMNGTHSGVPQASSTPPSEDLPNGQNTEGVNGFAGSNGHNVESASKDVSGEPDSFSDEQVDTLSVIVKPNLAQVPQLPPSASRTFSNGSIDSRSGVPDDSDKLNDTQSSLKVNGTGSSQGPFSPASVPSVTPVRLYWVKDKDAPVESLPLDSTYESYTLLRSKALEQRLYAPPGTCPYDMDVLYQFWSHFLIRSFNTRMYDEFRHFAFEDSVHRNSHVGLANLIKFYGESLLSRHSEMRDRVARHYVAFVNTESEHQRPAMKQMRSALRNDGLDPRNRERIDKYIDEELRAKLE